MLQALLLVLVWRRARGRADHPTAAYTLSLPHPAHPNTRPTPPCPALQTRLRKAIDDGIRAFVSQHSLLEPREVLDVGCSVGLSSRWLAAEWPQAQVTGLDLSPYFLAVAELRERQLAGGAG